MTLEEYRKSVSEVLAKLEEMSNFVRDAGDDERTKIDKCWLTHNFDFHYGALSSVMFTMDHLDKLVKEDVRS